MYCRYGFGMEFQLCLFLCQQIGTLSLYDNMKRCTILSVSGSIAKNLNRFAK